MNKALLILLSIFAISAQAETIILGPGESTTNGVTKIMCSGTQAPKFSGPPCFIGGAGRFENFGWAYITTIGDTQQAGFDDLSKAIESITKYANAGLCTPKPGICTLAGAGRYNNFGWQYRLAIDGQVMFAADNESQVLSAVASLRAAGLCR